MPRSLLIKNGTLITVDSQDRVFTGDLLVEAGRIVSVGDAVQHADSLIDATGCAVLPGFVQTHIHLCQTIFRGAADDLALIDWLKLRVWPMEAAHTAESVRAAARLGLAELIKGGTTCALTMETVNHTAEVFKAVAESGFRATVGKCMMDKGDGVPDELHEDSSQSIRESLSLLAEWHGAADGRIRYCFAPRFAVSCTRELLSQVAQLAREHRVMVHTHASENTTECQMVERETGLRNIAYLDQVGLTGRHVALAHCVHLDASEIELLRDTRTNVVHCPSSNLKLGSGIAPIHELLEHGVSVSLGADGAACNNRLDMFTEMRTAALLQKVKHGPEVLPAKRALRMATIDGARALGLEDEIGSLEVGKRADLALVRLGALHLTPGADVISTLVYSGQVSDVASVFVDGEALLLGGKLEKVDGTSVLAEATHEFNLLTARAGFGR
jgi:5-methylthioadenosine/S-adenosylhomocysteine deaminase